MNPDKPRKSGRPQRLPHSRSTNTSRDSSPSSPTRMRRVHPEEQNSRNSQDRQSSRGRRSCNDPNHPEEQNNPPDQGSGSSDPQTRRTSERRTRSAQGSSDGQNWPLNADGEPRSPFARKMDRDIARQCFSANSEQELHQQTPYERRQTRDDDPVLPRSSTLRSSKPGSRSPQIRSNVETAGARVVKRGSEGPDDSKQPGQYKADDVERNKHDERALSSKPHKCPRDWFLCNLALLILMIVSVVIGVWFAILNRKKGILDKKRSNYVP